MVNEIVPSIRFDILSNVCFATLAVPYEIRLVGGLRPSEGRVEMFYGQEWGTIW